MKQTVVFDFDGVIHSYDDENHFGKGVTDIPNPPIPGIGESIQSIMDAGYEVVIVSARCAIKGGVKAVSAYLMTHNIPFDRVIAEKPPALIYIDDRGYKFSGDASSLLSVVQTSRPYYEENYDNR